MHSVECVFTKASSSGSRTSRETKCRLFLQESVRSSLEVRTKTALLRLARHLASQGTLVVVFFFIWFLSTACVAQLPLLSELNAPFTLQLEQTILLPESKATLSFVEVLRDGRSPYFF
jgi:hypothetical protein